MRTSVAWRRVVDSLFETWQVTGIDCTNCAVCSTGAPTDKKKKAMSGFADFDAGHRDLVTVTKFNFYGNRIVTASSDHRMKVWDQKDGEWQLVDTWRAHDAEIRDVSSSPSWLLIRGSRPYVKMQRI